MVYIGLMNYSKMSSQVMKIVDILEDIKTQISDSQYKDILENLGDIYRLECLRPLCETLEQNRQAPVIRTHAEVTKLIYSIVQSKPMNAGKLAHILNEKGLHFSDYYFESFKQWMAENGVSVHGRFARVVHNVFSG